MISGYVFSQKNELIPDSTTLSDSKKMELGFIGGPFYNPERSLGLAAGVVSLFNLDKKDTLTQPSKAYVIGMGSLVGMYGGNTNLELYLKEDKIRFYQTSQLRNMPDYYWGNGFESAGNNENKEAYQRYNYFVNTKLLFRTIGSLYIGPKFDINYSNSEPLGTNPLLTQNADLEYFNSGMGFSLSYDSRDFVGNPFTGLLAELNSTYYTTLLGGEYNYHITEFTFNKYISLKKNKSILAAQFYSRIATGNVPFTELSLLGNPYNMRGYYWGRFRDKVYISAQIEYRQKIYKKHGIVLWLGAGVIGETVNTIDFRNTLPSFGVGYRFEFKKRVNARLDYGVGEDSDGFYFNAMEAF